MAAITELAEKMASKNQTSHNVACSTTKETKPKPHIRNTLQPALENNESKAAFAIASVPVTSQYHMEEEINRVLGSLDTDSSESEDGEEDIKSILGLFIHNK